MTHPTEPVTDAEAVEALGKASRTLDFGHTRYSRNYMIMETIKKLRAQGFQIVRVK